MSKYNNSFFYDPINMTSALHLSDHTKKRNITKYN